MPKSPSKSSRKLSRKPSRRPPGKSLGKSAQKAARDASLEPPPDAASPESDAARKPTVPLRRQPTGDRSAGAGAKRADGTGRDGKPVKRKGNTNGRGKAQRLPARKTFLVAARPPADGVKPDLRVYAAVKRTPAEALNAVRAELGPDVAVELTGKLSNRMAKTLGLVPDEVRQI